MASDAVESALPGGSPRFADSAAAAASSGAILLRISAGAGISDTWVRRITAISAAISALGASAASSSDLSSICQARVSVAIFSPAAIFTPRARSSGPTAGSLAVSGDILTTLIQWVMSARSRSTAIGSAPSACCDESSASAAAASPFMIRSNRSIDLPRSASPSIVRICSRVGAPPPWLMAWSSSEVASRAEPSAARAISASASSGTAVPSAWAIPRSISIIRSGVIRLRSNLWQRLSTVTGTLRISVVAKMNFTCSGGSSRVFSSALNALVESMWTSSMT